MAGAVMAAGEARGASQQGGGARTRTRGFALIVEQDEFESLLRDLSAGCRGAPRPRCYRCYLAGVWRRMAAARRGGARVLVAAFLLDQHVAHADAIGAEPFGTLALRAFDDFAARTCPQPRVWRGEPPDAVLRVLRAGPDPALLS